MIPGRMHLPERVIRTIHGWVFERPNRGEWDLRLFHSTPPIKPSVRIDWRTIPSAVKLS